MSDDFTWLEMLEAGPGADLNFNDKFFLPLAHYFQYGILFICGDNSFVLHLIQLLIHVINAFLLFLIISQSNKEHGSNKRFIALAGGLIFLLCPYNTEAVNWFAAISYPLSVLFFLISVMAGIKALTTGSNKHVFWFALFYLLSLLSKEITITVFLIPVAALIFGLVPKTRLTYRLLLSGLIVLIVYFFLRTLILGSVIGGYGSDVHSQFSFSGIIITLSAYIAKFFLMYRYLFAGWNVALWLKISIISILGIFWCIISLKALIEDRKLNKKKVRVFSFLAAVFVIFCMPVINLEITSLGSIQSDRYGYLISIAPILLFVFIFSNLNHRFSKIAVITVCALFLFLTFCTNVIYRQNDRIIKNILEDFGRNHQKGNSVVVLSIPDTYKGVYTFRHGFIQALHREYPWLIDSVEIFAWQTTCEQSNIMTTCDSSAISVTSYRLPFAKIISETSFYIETAKDKSSYLFSPDLDYKTEYMYFSRGRLHLLDCGIVND